MYCDINEAWNSPLKQQMDKLEKKSARELQTATNGIVPPWGNDDLDLDHNEYNLRINPAMSTKISDLKKPKIETQILPFEKSRECDTCSTTGLFGDIPKSFGRQYEPRQAPGEPASISRRGYKYPPKKSYSAYKNYFDSQSDDTEELDSFFSAVRPKKKKKITCEQTDEHIKSCVPCYQKYVEKPKESMSLSSYLTPTVKEVGTLAVGAIIVYLVVKMILGKKKKKKISQ